jgi:hypothetical protein
MRIEVPRSNLPERMNSFIQAGLLGTFDPDNEFILFAPCPRRLSGIQVSYNETTSQHNYVCCF